MSTHKRHQMVEEKGSIVDTGRGYRVIGNTLVFVGYFIGLAYLLMLYLYAFSLAEGMFAFWEFLVLPSWPWLLAAFLSIAAGVVFIGIDIDRRKHVKRPTMELDVAPQAPAPPQVHPAVEQPVEL